MRTLLIGALACALGCAADPEADPDAAIPDVAVPDIGAPDASAADIGAPDASAADVGAPDAGGPPRCNGAAHLCDRRFDEVAFAMTHNAHASSDAFNALAANQHLDLAAQLDVGVRGLGIKLYRTADRNCGPEGIYGYHGFPSLGCRPFADIAAPIRDFLTAHPREVLAVTVEGGASAADLAAALAEEGLDGWLHAQDRAAPWPTLGALVERDERLVVFSADDAAEGTPGLQHLWTRVQDTDYEAETFADFDCARARGPADARLFLLNHFITIVTPRPEGAADINRAARLGPRVADCAATRGLPNFVYVDFVDIGDVIAVVAVINGPEDVEARIAALRAMGDADAPGGD